MDKRTRVVLHLLLLILSVVTYAVYAVVKSIYFFAAAVLFFLSAMAVYFLSPDRKEWYDPSNFFLRFSTWSRKHPILLALLITAQVFIVLTIGFLLIMRDIRKFIINVAFCAVLFLCLSAFGLALSKKVGREEERED